MSWGWKWLKYWQNKMGVELEKVMKQKSCVLNRKIIVSVMVVEVVFLFLCFCFIGGGVFGGGGRMCYGSC